VLFRSTGTSHNECINGGWLNGVGIENCFNNGPGYGNMKVITVGSAHDSPDCDCESPCTCPTPTPVPTPTPIPTPTPPPIDCPSEEFCSANCQDSYSVVISGMTGDCNPYGCHCNLMVGATLTRDPFNSCQWYGSVHEQSCTYDDTWYSLSCTSKVWTLQVLTVFTCAMFGAANTTGCPPASGWVKVSGFCVGGSMTLR
jgi:hypothetical protein